MTTLLSAGVHMPTHLTELRVDRIIDERVSIIGADDLLGQCLGRHLTNAGAELVGCFPRPKDVPLSVLSDPIVLAIDPLSTPPCSTLEIVEGHPQCAVLILRSCEGQSVPAHERVAADAADVSTIIDSVQMLWQRVRPEVRERRGKHPLTLRQLQLLQMVADGFTTSEIALKVGVTAKTVNNHLGAVYRRLDTRNLTQAVLRAARLGLVKLP